MLSLVPFKVLKVEEVAATAPWERMVVMVLGYVVEAWASTNS
jgi:hypothetical protein